MNRKISRHREAQLNVYNTNEVTLPLHRDPYQSPSINQVHIKHATHIVAASVTECLGPSG